MRTGLMGFDTNERKLVPICASVSHPRPNVVRIEAAHGYTIVVMRSHVLISDGEDTFKIALLEHEGAVEVKVVADRVVEVHYK